jgi:hypothetical protein
VDGRADGHQDSQPRGCRNPMAELTLSCLSLEGPNSEEILLGQNYGERGRAIINILCNQVRERVPWLTSRERGDSRLSTEGA